MNDNGVRPRALKTVQGFALGWLAASVVFSALIVVVIFGGRGDASADGALLRALGEVPRFLLPVAVVGALYILIVGVPAYFLVKATRGVDRAGVVCVAAFLGAIPSAVLFSDSLVQGSPIAVFSVLANAAAGAIGGLVFWRVTRGAQPPHRAA